jgi:hypothetical protein
VVLRNPVEDTLAAAAHIAVGEVPRSLAVPHIGPEEAFHIGPLPGGGLRIGCLEEEVLRNLVVHHTVQGVVLHNLAVHRRTVQGVVPRTDHSADGIQPVHPSCHKMSR